MYRVKNWKKYQAFRKDRGTAPWRKLYVSFFADYHVRQLTEKQRFQLLGIFAFCDPKTGDIKKTPEELAHDIGCKSIELEDFQHFLKPLGNQLATTWQPPGNQLAPERRGEESREEDKVHCAVSDETHEGGETQGKTVYKYDYYFDVFWGRYPNIRRRAKRKCKAKIRTYVKSGILFLDIIEGLNRWIASDEWLREGGKYVCMPETWLNQERWLEYPSGTETDPESNLEGLKL